VQNCPKRRKNEKHQVERCNFQNLSDTTSQEEEQSELYSTLVELVN
jgi:hypothetical protein